MGRAEPASPPSVQVEVAYSVAAGTVQLVAVHLAPGATVAQALAAAGWTLTDELRVGIWGRLCALGDAVRDGDRVELTRPLTVDPKEARRLRYRKQRAAKGC